MENKHHTDCITPGQVWLDTEGRPIQAHGGGILFNNGVYYWFGENKDGETINNIRVDVIGVSCYSSTDLINWKYEGLALPAICNDPEHDLHTSKVVERPKVIYNDKTRKYVMWMHIDTADYLYARTGVAISDCPAGPYEYLGSFRPNGAESRDMTLFKDDDGRAYLIHSSELNSTTYIQLLTDDYLNVSGVFSTAFVKKYREAPALFKHNDLYYIINSGCSGWDPNQAEYAIAKSVMGPWETMGNPCAGPDADITFYAQSTYVFPVEGKSGKYIFMSDIWKPSNLRDSRYVWLPVMFNGDRIEIKWLDSWGMSEFGL